MSKEKRAIEVGDRVACYWSAGTREICTVEEIIPGGYRVKSAGGATLFAHPRQCRRLKSAKPKEEERVERVFNKYHLSMQSMDGAAINAYLSRAACQRETQCGYNSALRLLEVRPGEIVVSRHDLDRAWRETECCMEGNDAQVFRQLCKALGLPEKDSK